MIAIRVEILGAMYLFSNECYLVWGTKQIMIVVVTKGGCCTVILMAGDQTGGSVTGTTNAPNTGGVVNR